MPAPRAFPAAQGARPGDNWQAPASLGNLDEGSQDVAQGGGSTSSTQPISAHRVTQKTRQLIQRDLSPEKKQRIVQRWVDIVNRANADPVRAAVA